MSSTMTTPTFLEPLRLQINLLSTGENEKEDVLLDLFNYRVYRCLYNDLVVCIYKIFDIDCNLMP